MNLKGPSGISDARLGHAPLDDELSLLVLTQVLGRERRFLATCGAVFMLLVVAVTVLRGRTYTTTAAFVPQSSESGLSQLSGLAAQFGFSVPQADPSSSPAFYVSLLKSRDVLRNVVLTPYRFAWLGDTLHGTLVDLYDVRGKSPAARRDAAVGRLLDHLDIDTGRETGMVNVEVITPWAPLSQQVASRLIEMVSRFNLQIRQTRAGAERRFVEARLKEVADSLSAAEGRHKAFLQRNREFRNSPELVFENDRLQRDVQLQQQVYTSLAQSFEQARIDEVRNTPVITILEPPDLPASPDARRTILKALLGLLTGLALGALFVVARHLYRQALLRARIPPSAGSSAHPSVEAPHLSVGS